MECSCLAALRRNYDGDDLEINAVCLEFGDCCSWIHVIQQNRKHGSISTFAVGSLG